MSRTQARALLITSVVLLVVVGAAWGIVASGDPRSDLAGASVTTTSTTPTTTTTTTSVVDPPVTLPEPAPTVPAPPLGVPQQIRVPQIGVDALVTSVGLEDDGAMEVPPAALGGWYQYGPRTGSPEGSTVIAGHVDQDDERGIFYDLRSVEVGAEVEVLDDTGTWRRYSVTERFQVDKDELPIDELFRTQGPPVLTLITCGGAFDRSGRSYEDNIVVRAVPLPV